MENELVKLNQCICYLQLQEHKEAPLPNILKDEEHHNLIINVSTKYHDPSAQNIPCQTSCGSNLCLIIWFKK